MKPKIVESFPPILHPKGFTLIELLITIGIISLLMTLLITNFDRLTAGNRVANDVEVLRSKLAATKLLAGSTQIIDDPGTSQVDQAGYYGLYLPETGNQYFQLRLPISLNPADAQSDPCSKESDTQFCLVEAVQFTRNVQFAGPSPSEKQIIAYATPTQQLFQLRPPASGSAWERKLPDFSGFNFTLTYQGRSAKVMLDGYAGRVNVEYKNPN